MASTTLFEQNTTTTTQTNQGPSLVSSSIDNSKTNGSTSTTSQISSSNITFDSLFDDLYLINQLSIDENDAFLNKYLHNNINNNNNNNNSANTPQTPSPPLIANSNTSNHHHHQNMVGFNQATLNILSSCLSNLTTTAHQTNGHMNHNFDDNLEFDADWIFNNNPIAQQQQQQQHKRVLSTSSSPATTTPGNGMNTQQFATLPCAYSQCLIIRNQNFNSKTNGKYLNEYVYLKCTNAKCCQLSPRIRSPPLIYNNENDQQFIQLHQICYDAILNDHLNNNQQQQQQQQRIRSNSLEFINKSKLKQQQQITCFKCKNGYLIPIDMKYHHHQMSPSPPHLQQQQQQQQQQGGNTNGIIPLLPIQQIQQNQNGMNRSKSICQPNNNNNNNNNSSNKPHAQFMSSSYQSAPINIHRNQTSNANNNNNNNGVSNQRKRSLGNINANNNNSNSNSLINNPPLPTPMQPLHEYNTSDDTTTTTTTVMCNPKQIINGKKQPQQVPPPAPPSSFSNNYHHSQYQSAPVAIQQRYRTLSTGSTGSFSASSSFSSNSIGACSPIWRKMFNNSSSSNQPSSSAASTTTTTTASSLNNNSILPASVTSVSSTSSSICTYKLNGEYDEQFEKELASSGNMFYKRNDWSILSQIPTDKQNPIHIRLEDEGPYGNDETRCFVLSHFSSLCKRDIECVLCKNVLQIYDRFPLVDGTLFVSPIIYGDKEKAIKATISQKEQYIYAVCLSCLNGDHHEVRCKWCRQLWKSSSLQIGTLYKYDIFAAFPCCSKRCECKKCAKQIIDLNSDNSATLVVSPQQQQQHQHQQTNGSQQHQPIVQQQPFYFSSYSEEIDCPHCKTKSYHFIKPLDTIFTIVPTK